MVSRTPKTMIPATDKRRSGASKSLQRLMDAGALRFSVSQDDDKFADVYARTLETALLATMRRNQLCKAKVESLRRGNTELRASIRHYNHVAVADKHSPTSFKKL